jgi:hypothetical protein
MNPPRDLCNRAQNIPNPTTRRHQNTTSQNKINVLQLVQAELSNATMPTDEIFFGGKGAS